MAKVTVYFTDQDLSDLVAYVQESRHQSLSSYIRHCTLSEMKKSAGRLNKRLLVQLEELVDKAVEKRFRSIGEGPEEV